MIAQAIASALMQKKAYLLHKQAITTEYISTHGAFCPHGTACGVYSLGQHNKAAEHDFFATRRNFILHTLASRKSHHTTRCFNTPQTCPAHLP